MGTTCLCGYNINSNSVKLFVIIANNFTQPKSDKYQNMNNIIDNFVNDNFK